MKFKTLLGIRLDLFDGGAAAAGASTGAAAPAQAGTGTQGDTKSTVPGSTRRGKSGEFQNVIFGKQPEQAAASTAPADGNQQSSAAGKDTKEGVTVTSDTLESRRKAYMDLVNSEEYKDIHTQETQRMLNRRFKESKALEQQLSQYQPFIDMMMQRYKITDGDIGKLTAAAESDNAYWSAAAEEAGMSVEMYKQFQRLQRENAAFRQATERQRVNSAMQQQLQAWNDQAKGVKAKYESFDLNTETQNPQFMAMLKANVPMLHAYEVLHMEEIKQGVAQTTAQETEKKVVDGIRAKGARPQENGTASRSAFVVKDDVSKLTKQDRAEAIRRAARGERIEF